MTSVLGRSADVQYTSKDDSRSMAIEVISVLFASNPIAADVPSSRHIEKTTGTFGKSPSRIASNTFRLMKPPRPTDAFPDQFDVHGF